MGYIALPRRLFLWSMALIYMSAFVSLYMQIPGLYGNEGLLPARKQLRYSGDRSLWAQFQSSPTLLWLSPKLGLSTHTSVELLCLVGAALSLAATLLEPLRDSLVFFVLWLLYLSLYQVGQVFLYFQWDNLLLETGFLCVLVAPLCLVRGGPRVERQHDRVTFWLLRWLLFRLMFASGVVKLTSRCPTWWGLTALTYHYETQCIPTSLAWFAHQLPVWWQKLSVVGTFVIEIPVPFLFFSPLRRLRLGAFYLQLLLQVLIILSGNYNFFNLLTLALCLSLLDDQHVNFLLRKPQTTNGSQPESKRWSWLCYLLEIAVWSGLIFGAVVCFDLQLDWAKKSVTSRTAFTFHQFNQWLKTVTIPCIWVGLLSLFWEMVSSMYRCACVEGFFKRFLSTLQWMVFGAAAVAMFSISLVPFTYLEQDSAGRLWPGVRQAHQSVDRLQLVNSYGLFRRMTGVGGRPEVVIEGSQDRVTWTEIDFMYKPGNASTPPPLVTPHQPRLDWQMWFAALGPHSQAPWFTSLMYRLLQGNSDVVELLQADASRYPFHAQPPAFLRAHLYKYWFTEPKEDGSYPERWWRRVYVEEFYPTVYLGDPFLENMLYQHGLKDKSSPRRPSNATVPRAVQWLRSQVKGQSAPALIWSLMAGSAVLCLCLTRTPPPRPARPGAARQGGSNRTAQDATPGAETPPEEGGEEEEEEEEEEGGDGEVCKVKPEESEDEDKNDPGDEEQQEEEEDEEVCKVKPEESEDEDKNDPGDEEQAEEEEEDERADVPRKTDASGMKKRK
ncbi:lipase maturation factor 2a isoform X2 [Gadus macrocephalus]|uniref:lipase maturation factor 2a isoform X2 n=1 Tax=Gadus macrocephalus TaxID=80720 RepID=UPI0028CBAEA7|nr:lipase maturation factor 2a isoform X2 [Gadus macrocephalus]